MKLSELVTKFDAMETQAQASGANVLTKDQAHIFRDIFARYKTERYAVLDAKSGLVIGSL